MTNLFDKFIIFSHLFCKVYFKDFITKKMTVSEKMKSLIPIILLIFTTTVYAADKLTLTEMQELVLTENPKIKAMERETEMFYKKAKATGVLDDPRLKLGLNSIPLNDFSFRKEDMTTKEIGISQMFPLGGKLKIKESIAYRDYEISLQKLRKEKIEMLNDLRATIYELIYVREATNIINDIKKLNDANRCPFLCKRLI